MKNVSAIIVAAGTGTRLGQSSIPKPFYPLGSQALIAYSLDVLGSSSWVSEIIVVTQKEFLKGKWDELLGQRNDSKVKIKVEGGPTRAHSVLEGLKHAVEDLVLVHDAARPFMTEPLLERVVQDAIQYGCAIPGVPVKSTVKEVSKNNFVTRTHDRNFLREIQTPQVVLKKVLEQAYQENAHRLEEATDEASLVEWIGQRVYISEGEENNLKITTPQDLELAEFYLKERTIS